MNEARTASPPRRTRVIAVLLAVAATAIAAFALVGRPFRRADAELATPRATAYTLLRSYGLDTVPQRTIHARLRKREHFALIDKKRYKKCFEDLRGPSDEGLAGFVVGILAAGRDRMQVTSQSEEGRIRVGDQTIVMVRHADGYRISLRKTVPEAVQTALRQVSKRAYEMARRNASGVVR